MKDLIVKIIKGALDKLDVSLEKDQIKGMIEIPPNYEMGDYAFPCFFLSKIMKISPNSIALEIRERIGNPPEEFSDIQTVGPYVNFFVDRVNLAKNILLEINTKKESFGSSDLGKGKNIVVEFSSPNVAKPFGIGHLRSTIIGNSISRIAEFQGYKSIDINFLGDWGTPFGKILLGYSKWGDEKKLSKDPIKHLYELYVKVNKNEKYEPQAREWFKRLEQGDAEARNLWKKFRDLSLKEFNEIYSMLGIEFDVISGESMYNEGMKEITDKLNKKKLLKESENALIVDLEEYNLGVVLIQKSDGTTLYATRDIATAIDRYNKYNFSKMIYEVGQEQKLHFQQIFKTLELMGHDWAKSCEHVYHGLYLDKDGKKFSTRKGKTIFMKDVIEETVNLAKKEILKREKKISKKLLNEKAMKLAIAAIFYGDLKNNRVNDMVFDIKKFLSFEGNTGPYLLYSYARANSIIKKSKKIKRSEFPENLEKKEIELILKLSEFPEIVKKSFNDLNPSQIASYSYQLAQSFNEFYHSCKVIGSDKEFFRVELTKAFKQVLKNSLYLIGIETLEEM